MIDTGSIISVILLLGGSAFFSASETAFSSVNLLRLKAMADDGDAAAKVAVDILSQFDKMLCTILIGNNIVNIGLSSLTTLMAQTAFGNSAVAIATGITTFLVLTFGEILPKSLAKEYSETIVHATAPILKFLMIIGTPFSWFFIKLRDAVTKRNGNAKPTITENELIYMLDTIEQEGVLEAQEKDLVQSALEFDETTVQEVLTPRVDILAFDVEDSPEEILNAIKTEKYSRVPVYEDNMDNIIGWVRSMDVLEVLLEGKPLNIKEIMNEVMFVHRTMKLSKLLGEFQKKKIHMAIVIDDYGGTLGIVTMEDVLEELVGEIWDEDDEITTELTAADDGSYIVSGNMNVHDFFDTIDYEPDDIDGSYNTVNGWAMENFQHIPEVGESFECGLLSVQVTAIEDQKISQLKVIKHPEPEEE